MLRKKKAPLFKLFKLFNAFTLIEILVVMTIVGVLAVTTSIGFSSSLRSSRDAKRKADLEQIKAALELYRASNNTYPAVGTGVGQIQLDCTSNGALTDPVGGTGTYLSNLPKDPACPTSSYSIATTQSDYTLGAHFEGTTSTCTVALSCGTGIACNYCLGPLGPRLTAMSLSPMPTTPLPTTIPPTPTTIIPTATIVPTPTPVILTFTTNQTFVVPSTVTNLGVLAKGAAGGGSSTGSAPLPGGNGAQVAGRIAVTPGESLTIKVGGLGQPGLQSVGSDPGRPQGGLNGGGNGGRGIEAVGPVYRYGAGGGGASGVFRGTTPLFIAAGGGGGGTYGAAGGNGGDNVSGSNGANPPNTALSGATGGSGATSTAGGSLGGAANQGGTGQDVSTSGNNPGGGGGGGGGYFGGGGGTSAQAYAEGGGGGGGTSFAAAAATNVGYVAGSNTGAGIVYVSY